MLPWINAKDGVSIFAVTPTYKRVTQKVDLTSLCYTVENIPNFIWIVVEDSDNKSSLVSSLLARCKVSVIYVYSNHNLHVPKVSRLVKFYISYGYALVSTIPRHDVNCGSGFVVNKRLLPQ